MKTPMINALRVRRFLRLALGVLPLLAAFLAGCAAKPPVADNAAKEDAAKKMSELGLSSKKNFNKGDE